MVIQTIVEYLEPFPKVFLLPPMVAYLFGLLPYLTIQGFRVLHERLPFIPKSAVVAYGDVMFAVIFASTAQLMQDANIETLAFYHNWWWFAIASGIVTLGNLGNEAMNFRKGQTWKKFREVGMLWHTFGIVPFVGLHIVGIAPHLLLDVEFGGEHVLIFIALCIYIGSYVVDARKKDDPMSEKERTTT